jgi:hypothetical protein
MDDPCLTGQVDELTSGVLAYFGWSSTCHGFGYKQTA